MRKEWRIFLTAVMFLTRIRVPAGIDHHPDYLQKSPKYFPVIGWIVGCLSVFALLIFGCFFSLDIAILASMIAGILTTGAFHEDGFADTCDGFGGGWTREKILLIMKDSRIGAFGAIGLISVLAAKFLLLKEIAGLQTLPLSPGKGARRDFTGLLHDSCGILTGYRYCLVAILTAHSLSRLVPVMVIRFFDYAADPDTSKSKPVATKKLLPAELVVAILAGLLPFVFLPWYFLLTIPPVALTGYALARYFKKWIHGYTGDCLGAIQQVTELIFYMVFVIIWKYAI